MSEVNEQSVAPSVGRLGFARSADVDLFMETLARFERGEIDADAWRQFRLLNGVYGQRQDDVHMLRVKIPQGIVTARQLEALADVAERWGGGVGHITTRQNVQYHFIPLDVMKPALDLLAESGFTTKEACGNSVRNVTQCSFAGVSAAEPFDSNPYAEALTRFLLRGKWSSTLPRKFKIAFGGCCAFDCIGAAFNDIGLFARVKDGRRGFQVTAAGGLSTQRRNGVLVHDFLPVEELFEMSEAVVRVFHHHGDRHPNHRHKARLKFVVDRLKAEGFLAEYEKERALIREEGGRPFSLGEPAPLPREKPAHVVQPLPGFEEFVRTNVRAQKQPGYSAVTVKVTLGDLSVAQWRGLADIARRFSAEEEARLTMEQNVVLRYVRTDSLAALHEALFRLGLSEAGALTVLDVTSCPGARSCKLAVTQSRGMATLVQEHLTARPDVAAKAEKLVIKVSGCPNSCGQHHVSGIGWQGGMKKIGGRTAPLYHLYVGGRLGERDATYGRLAAKVPARRAGLVTERLIELYDAQKEPGEDPNAYFARVALGDVKKAIDGLLDIDEATATEEDFIDLGEKTAFVVEITAGECAA